MMTERITLKLGRDASDLSTTSDSVQMSHTGSEGVLSLPDPPLAGNIPSTVTRAGGIAPSPLVTTSSQSKEEMVTPFFKADPLDGEEDSEDSEDEDIYELLSDEFDAARLQESTNLLPGRASLEAGEQDSARSGMQNVAVVKRERTAIQITTFVNWINDRLKVGKNDRKVEDLFVDLRDGMLLIKLLENLTKKKVKGFTGKVPKTEAHKIVNLDLAFQFMESEQIKMVGVGGMNIYQGNMTLTLGMIWMLIQKYQMRIHGYKVSTKQVMITWVQALLPKWNITNLTSDWCDGRALIAVLNVVKPGLAPMVSTLDPAKRKQNCTLATKIAHSYLKIPKIISPDDLSSGNVDELSIMTYLSYFVEPFQAKLLKWVQKTLPQFNITNFSSDWYDGRAFGALIKACFDDVFINWGLLDGDSPVKYIDEMLRTTKKKLGINPPFKSQDLVSGKVEEMQIATLIMQIRNGNLISLPGEVVVRGRGIEAASLQKETSFVIDTTEAGPGQLFVDACYENDGRKLKFALTEKTKHVFCLTYTPQQTSKIIFNILWSNQPIPRSPFVVPVTDATLVRIVDFDSHGTLVEVGKPLSLLFEAKKAGQGHLSGYLQCGRERVQAMTKNLPDRTIQLEYTPTRPGKAVLHIFWNKEELRHLSVMYTVVDIGGYSVKSFPKSNVCCTFEELEFCIESEKGLPLNVLQMTAVLNLDVQLPIKFKSVDGNLGHTHFTPTLPGEYRVEVVCVDQLIKGCPFTVRVADPHSCKVRGDIPSCLQLSKPHTFEIDIKEAGGIGEISFDSSDDGISRLFKSKTQPGESAGLQWLEVTPQAEGDFLVGIKYQHQWISNSPFRVQICDPTKFTISGNPTVANIGQPVELTIRGKERCEGPLKPVIRAVGPSAKYSPVIETSRDGLLHTVKFSPWEVGEHEIRVTYGGFDVPRSPVKIPVVSFDSSACSATGSGLQRAYTHVPAQFVVKGKEEGLIADGTLSIKIASVVDGEECRIRARDNSDRTYSVAYLVQKTGAYLISIQTAGRHIPGSPFRLNVLQGPEAHKCQMYGLALDEEAILVFGQPIDFTVDTSKAGTGKLSVKATGPDNMPARVFTAKSSQPGKYDISIDTFRHGKHRVSVKWSNQHISGSPFTIKVFPGADARKCVAYGPGLEDGRVGKKSSFTIETKNAGAGMLRVRLHGLKGAFKIEIAPVDQQNRRTLLANYNPQLPGEYLITIKWSEVHIPGSPFRVRMVGEGKSGHSDKPVIFVPTPPLLDLGAFEELSDDDDGDDDMRESSESVATNYASAPVLNSTQSKPVELTPTPLTFSHSAKEQARGSIQSQKMVTFSNMNRVRHHKVKKVSGKRRTRAAAAAAASAQRMKRRRSDEYTGRAILKKH